MTNTTFSPSAKRTRHYKLLLVFGLLNFIVVVLSFFIQGATGSWKLQVILSLFAAIFMTVGCIGLFGSTKAKIWLELHFHV